jgi:diadenylate cyclase
MNPLLQFIQQTAQLLQQARITGVIDLLVVFFAVYEILKLLKDTRAMQMAAGVAVVAVIYQLSHWFRLTTVEFVMRHALVYVGFGIIVLFQNEIRAALTHFGNNLRNPFAFRTTREKKPLDTFDEVILAATTFAAQKTGALIVFERNVGLQEYVNRGVKMDAALSYDLLVNIFNTAAPLHDGAVIIRQRRIAAASCFLPLTLNPRLSKELGTRHRAAIGITEESDAFVIVVSEETGVISCVERGYITRNLDSRKLRAVLSRAMDLSQAPTSPRRYRRRIWMADDSFTDISNVDSLTGTDLNETPPSGTPVLIGGERRVRERGFAAPAAFLKQGGHWYDIFKTAFRYIFVRNARLKLIAGILTGALYLSANTQEPIPFVLRGVPVEFTGMRNDLTISNQDMLREVTIRVRGPRDEVERLRPDSFKVVIPLNGKNPGDRVIRLREDAKVLKPDNTQIEILEIDPQRLTVSLERQVEQQVEIKPSFRGSVPSDFELLSFRVTPERTTLRGPESRVFALQSVGTETIWLNMHPQAFTERYKIDVKDPQVEIVGAQEVEVQVEIRPILFKKSFEMVLNDPLAVPTRVVVEVEGLKSVVEKLKTQDIRLSVGPLRADRPGEIDVQAVLNRDIGETARIRSVSPATAPVKK